MQTLINTLGIFLPILALLAGIPLMFGFIHISTGSPSRGGRDWKKSSWWQTPMKFALWEIAPTVIMGALIGLLVLVSFLSYNLLDDFAWLWQACSDDGVVLVKLCGACVVAMLIGILVGSVFSRIGLGGFGKALVAVAIIAGVGGIIWTVESTFLWQEEGESAIEQEIPAIRELLGEDVLEFEEYEEPTVEMDDATAHPQDDGDAIAQESAPAREGDPRYEMPYKIRHKLFDALGLDA